jgi:hypothetical protein
MPTASRSLCVQILLRHSTYQHVNRDRLFFEALYITIINICDDALSALHIRRDIEILMGRIFRGRYFNLYDRVNAVPRSIDTLSLKELYAIKQETENRALNSKLLSSLNARPKSLNISASAVNHSPLIYEMISSVITARALIKDPEFRKERSADLLELALLLTAARYGLHMLNSRVEHSHQIWPTHAEFPCGAHTGLQLGPSQTWCCSGGSGKRAHGTRGECTGCRHAWCRGSGRG